MGSWSSAQAPGGVREDAERFARDALEHLSSVLGRTEASFNEFVGRHRGKVYGPVDAGTKELRYEFKEGEVRINSLKGLEINSLGLFAAGGVARQSQIPFGYAPSSRLASGANPGATSSNLERALE